MCSFTKHWIVENRLSLEKLCQFKWWQGEDRGNFFLQRRNPFCTNPPDLSIALVAILLHGNKINTNLFKEVWDVAFFICSGKYKCQEPIMWHLDAMHSMSLFSYFLFLVACIVMNCKKYTNHKGKVFFFMLGLLYHLIESNCERGALKGKRHAWKNWFCDNKTKSGKENPHHHKKLLFVMKKGRFLCFFFLTASFDFNYESCNFLGP